MACTRIMRALEGHEVRPMTSMTLNMLLPKMETIISTRKNVGIIRKILMTSDVTLSSTPPKYPAKAPSRVPIRPEIRADTMPMVRLVRLP